MNAATDSGLLAAFRRFTANLRYPQLFLLVAALLVVDLVIPDAIPFADEMLLALITLILSRLRERREPEPQPKNVTPR